MFAIDGYKFSYNTRELVVYPYTSASQLAPHDDVIIFRVCSNCLCKMIFDLAVIFLGN